MVRRNQRRASQLPCRFPHTHDVLSGLWPNLDKKIKLPFFDLKDSIATDTEPKHNFFLKGQEVAMMPKLLRMNVRNMHRFLLTRQQRNRMLDVLTLYYQLHVPEFRDLRSLAVLREVLA